MVVVVGGSGGGGGGGGGGVTVSTAAQRGMKETSQLQAYTVMGRRGGCWGGGVDVGE